MRGELARLSTEVGELIQSWRTRDGSAENYGRYRNDPVGFLREALGAEPWGKQVEIAEALLHHPLVTVRSCHASGKDWLAARLALWWSYAREGLALLTGPTASQVEEILMRGRSTGLSRQRNYPGISTSEPCAPGSVPG